MSDENKRIALLIEHDLSEHHERTRYSVLLRPRLSKDGGKWCALYGENLQEGVAGFGDTPDAALRAFDQEMVTSTSIPVQDAPATVGLVEQQLSDVMGAKEREDSVRNTAKEMAYMASARDFLGSMEPPYKNIPLGLMQQARKLLIASINVVNIDELVRVGKALLDGWEERAGDGVHLYKLYMGGPFEVPLNADVYKGGRWVPATGKKRAIEGESYRAYTWAVDTMTEEDEVALSQFVERYEKMTQGQHIHITVPEGWELSKCGDYFERVGDSRWATPDSAEIYAERGIIGGWFTCAARIKSKPGRRYRVAVEDWGKESAAPEPVKDGSGTVASVDSHQLARALLKTSAFLAPVSADLATAFYEEAREGLGNVIMRSK